MPDYLGPPRFHDEVAFRVSRPGVATGVAWTETGGDVLFIEARLLPSGHHNLILTGQLGNVMQESARAAVSHIRAAGDGAGHLAGEVSTRTICTSTCRRARFPRTDRRRASRWRPRSCRRCEIRSVREDVAMTGEITLSGLVLPVGGIREKALAARRHGIKEFILPARNEPDLAELPAEVKDGMRFIPVRTLEEALKVALPRSAPRQRRITRA